jgi:hypothetical protein
LVLQLPQVRDCSSAASLGVSEGGSWYCSFCRSETAPSRSSSGAASLGVSVILFRIIDKKLGFSESNHVGGGGVGGGSGS